MVVFGVIGVVALRSSSATGITVKGRVYDSRTNLGRSGVVIYGCSSHGTTHRATTNSTGYWSFNISVGYLYCARVVSGVPSNWSGPVTNNRPSHSTLTTYEYQVAGVDCIHNPSSAYCDANADSYDRSVDTGVDFRYTSPTPPPSISYFTASPTTITAGNSSKLSWSSNGTACSLAYGSTRKSLGSSGSLLVRPAQSITYTLTCSNSGGTSAAKSQTITVHAASSGSSGGSSGGSNPTPRPITGISRPADTSPPSTPTGFKATIDNTSQTIMLTWKPSKDNVKVVAYQLDRSEDKQNWDILSTSISDTSFNDQSANFGVHYYYRLKAIDGAGNGSKYAQTDITIDSFEANAIKDSDTTITSDDNVISILIPAGALTANAFCNIITPTDILPPALAGYKFISGPYSLNCRDAGGNTVTGFEKPLVLSAQVDRNTLTGVKQVDYFGQKDDGSWEKLKVLSHDKKTLSDSVDPGSDLTFVIMGKQKKTSIVVVIFKLLIALVIILALIRFIVRLILRRRAEQQYEDYLHKSEGL